MKRALLPIIFLTVLSVNIAYGLEIEQVGVYDFGVAYDIAVDDNIAYLSGNDGVDVFDITDKTNPIKLTRITCTPNGALGLYVSGDTLYIGATSNGLKIMDVSDPSHPTTLSMVTEVDSVDVYVEHEYAYVASSSSFSVIDISDTSNPNRIATVQGYSNIYQIHAVQDTLYVGEVNQGVLVYDLTDPTEPTYIRTISGTSGVFDITSKEDTLYLGCHQYGVKIYDITDRQNPQLVGTHNNGGEAYGVCIADDYLLVADLQQGVEILDVSNPNTPTLAARWTTTHPHGVAGDTEYVYLADQDDGLEIFMYGEEVESVVIAQDLREEANRIPLNNEFLIAGLMISVILLRRLAPENNS